MRAQNRRNGAPQGALYLFGCVFRRPDLSAKLRAERVAEGFGVSPRPALAGHPLPHGARGVSGHRRKLIPAGFGWVTIAA